MVWLDGRVDLASQALLLVLAAAVAAVGWPLWLSLVACLAAVLAFNFAFVPPRGSFSVDLHQHALLLATMLAVSVVVAVLMAQQRRLALRERRQARQSEQLRHLGDALREVDDPRERAALLQQVLTDCCGHPAVLLLPHDTGVRVGLQALPGAEPGADVLGEPTADERAGLSCATVLARPWARARGGMKTKRPVPAAGGRSGAYGVRCCLRAWAGQPPWCLAGHCRRRPAGFAR
jgi:two-component system sensor histidine kinase KdpD